MLRYFTCQDGREDSGKEIYVSTSSIQRFGLSWVLDGCFGFEMVPKPCHFETRSSGVLDNITYLSSIINF